MRALRQAFHFFLEIVVDFLPGGTSLRVQIHKLRGVHFAGRCFISRHVTLETKYPEKIWIGSNVFIGIGTTVIAHHDTAEDLAGVNVAIGDNAYIGPHCVILPGASIGENSVVAAGSVVNKPISPNQLVRGNPCSLVAEITTPLGLDGDMVSFMRGLRNFKKS
jgi:acetyltransferase-like isoleucine patch superfamily enzyme